MEIDESVFRMPGCLGSQGKMENAAKSSCWEEEVAMSLVLLLGNAYLFRPCLDFLYGRPSDQYPPVYLSPVKRLIVFLINFSNTLH